MATRVTKEDILIGQRLRLARKELGITQTDLAELWGMTFQQVQKYESGTNRVTASKLFQFSDYYKVDFSIFDINNIDDDTAKFVTAYKALNEDDQELVSDFIKTLKKRKRKNHKFR